MRRRDRRLSEEEAREVLRTGEYGVLSTNGEDGYPYAVPLCYAYDEAENRVIFHGVNGTGMKYENVSRDSRACLTVVGEREPLPAKFSTRYFSVIAFGEVRLLEGEEEKRAALMKLVEKYSPDFRAQGERYAASAWQGTAVYVFTIRSMTGKARKQR